jgi:hypothetical protein
MENQTLAYLPSEDILKHGGDWYAGMAALVAAIAAAIGSVIYASKHVKNSSCLGSKCEQEVMVEAAVPAQRVESNV